MSFRNALKREIEVAFSKHSQPIWFKILKYFLLGCLLYFLWGSKWLWIILLVLFPVSMLLHFWYRYKTQGWTKSYACGSMIKTNQREKRTNDTAINASILPMLLLKKMFLRLKALDTKHLARFFRLR